MNIPMTFYTNWHNIQPMLRLIAEPMVVLLCLFRTVIAPPSIGTGQFAGSDGVIYSVFSFRIVRVAGIAFCLCLTQRCFALGGFEIFCICCPAFGSLLIFRISLAMSCLAVRGLLIFCFCLAINCLATFTLFVGLFVDFMTGFAPIEEAVLPASVFGKFRNWLSLLAFGTVFGHDLLGHNRFSNKRLCLEPVAEYSCIRLAYYK